MNENNDEISLDTDKFIVGDDDFDGFGYEGVLGLQTLKSYQRVDSQYNNNPDVSITIRVIDMPAGFAYTAFNELDQFMAQASQVRIKYENDNGVKYKRVAVSAAPYTNVSKNVVMERTYKFTSLTPWYTNVTFQQYVNAPNDTAANYTGLIFKANGEAITFGANGDGIIFGNEYSGFVGNQVYFDAEDYAFSTETTPFTVTIGNLRKGTTTTNITLTKIGKTRQYIYLRIPNVIVTDGAVIKMETTYLSRKLVIVDKDGHEQKITPYQTNPQDDPFIQFDNGYKNSFSTDNGTFLEFATLNIKETI